MNIESTEIKISLTVREAQSLATILNRINDAHRKSIRVNLAGVPHGSFDDCWRMENDLLNLLQWSGIKS